MGEQKSSEPEVHRIDSFDAWFSYLLQEAGVRHGEADTDWTWPDENYEETEVAYVTELLENPEKHLGRLSEEHLATVCQCLNNAVDSFLSSLLCDSVPWPPRKRAFLAMRDFLETFLGPRCQPELSHGKRASGPINGVVYIWWDPFPTWGSPEDRSKRDLDEEILGILEHLIYLPNPALVECGLHGLGHWHLRYRERVERIIDGFLKLAPGRRPPPSQALIEYAKAARCGAVE